MNNIPLILIKMAEYFANAPKCFIDDVNIAIRIIIMHCPSANEKRSPIEKRIFFDTVASAIMLRSRGDEHGLDAKAKNAPTIKGKINKLPLLFCGIFFINAGKFISKKPIRFSPKIKIIDAKIKRIIGEAIDVNALPVYAQKIPIMLNTKDNPTENESI